jgi:hypothetical protein
MGDIGSTLDEVGRLVGDVYDIEIKKMKKKLARTKKK